MSIAATATKLRPAKVSGALRRRWFERQMASIPLTPYEPMVHLGTPYGGWWVPDDLIGPDWLCYSVGAGSDISFDLELIARYGARVRAFDPFEVFGQMAERAAAGDPRFSFHEAAVTATDGPVRMYGRQDDENGSVSAANLYGAGTSFVKRGRSLPSLMDELGDTEVQLLKLDVEGSEYELLPTLDLPAMGVRVLGVELHHNQPASQARELVAGLAARGYVPVWCKHPSTFTFVRR